MAEGLTLADGTPVDIDAAGQQFAAAMAAPEPGEAPDYPAPPRKDPEAPYGYMDDGVTPKKAMGRPKSDPASKPRTAKTVPAAPPRGSKSSAVAEARDYTQGLTDVGTAVWVGLAGLPWTRPYSVLWRAQVPAMARAWNAAAQENAQVRVKVAKIASGEGGMWILGVALATAPVLGGVVALLSDREARAQFMAQGELDLQEWMTVNMPAQAPEPQDAAPAAEAA
jgi:hypothetical protein